jgi:hypothetical protein
MTEEKQKPEFTFAALYADNVLPVWSTIEPMIERALQHDYDGMTTHQVLSRILRDDITLIVVERGGLIVACMTLEYVQRKERICHCMTFAGDGMDNWVEEFIDTWREIASETGCRYLSIKGRQGWERYAAHKFGFKHAYTQMYLDIEETEK